MIFVLPLFIIGGFVLLAVWFCFFRTAVRHESAVKAAKEREANFDRLLLTPNETLYCLDCQKDFPGPLDEDGCPNCHVRAFVIPARARAEANKTSGSSDAGQDAVKTRQSQRKR